MTQYEQLYKKVKSILDKSGMDYECKKDYSECFIVKTKIGEWRIRPNKDKGCKVWTIFTRFNDEELIPDYLVENFRANTFSGKMNFHDMTILDVIWKFEYAVKLLVE